MVLNQTSILPDLEGWPCKFKKKKHFLMLNQPIIFKMCSLQSLFLKISSPIKRQSWVQRDQNHLWMMLNGFTCLLTY